MIGLHYFSPVDKMMLVEVIPHQHTSETTIATTVALAKRQGKRRSWWPIAPLYVNRILAPYMNEAMRCLLEGEPMENIDGALVKFGFPLGPVQLLDEVGIDTGTKILPILEQARERASPRRRRSPPCWRTIAKGAKWTRILPLRWARQNETAR